MGKNPTPGSGSGIYGLDDQSYASNVSTEALGSLAGAGTRVDVNGVKDGRAKTDLDMPDQGTS